MGAVLSCNREGCEGELAPTRDENSPTKKITGYFCKRCGVTYAAVEVPKSEWPKGQRVAPAPRPGEITGRIDDFESSERQKLVGRIETLERMFAQIDDLTSGAEAGMGRAIQDILNPDTVTTADPTEEVPDEEVVAE